jgi:hypothetical protein
LGNGDELQEMADISNGRDADGTYSTETDAFPIIGCASGFNMQEVKNGEELLKKLQSISPTFYRNFEASDLEEQYCEEVFLGQKILNIKYSGVAPVVVVGGENDPATPFRWSEEMTANMGDSAVLVTYTGEGHGQVFDSRCVAKIAGLVFTKKQAPKEGTVCKPDVPVAEPTWWKEATANIGGTKVDTSLGNYYFSLEPVDGFARYQAIVGSTATVFESVTRQLTKNGYPFYGSNDADPTKSPQWFQSTTDEEAIIRIWIESPSALSANGMHLPDGKLPKGSSLVMLFYVPPAK